MMSQRIFPLFLIGCLIAFLSACSGPRTVTQSPQDVAQDGASQLSVIESLIDNGQLLDAEHQLKRLDPVSLTELDRIHFYWASARLAIALSRGDDAITALNAVIPGDFERLTHLAPNAVGYARAQALYLKGEFIASARERMFLSGVLSGDEYRNNHEAIWASLIQAESNELKDLAATSTTSLFKGWLDLALLIKENQLDLDRQLAALRRWQARYDGHAAAKSLPGGLDQLEHYVRNKPKTIALMVPLSGKLGSTGRAVRDGLFAAYYQAQKAGVDVPEIRIYDTADSKDFWSLYKQAILDGNELIIGPMVKSEVERLQQEESLPVPTLALNYGWRDNRENPAQLFQFGLAVEDEAELAARYARQLGYERAVAIMPKGAWGERVFERFINTWQAQGGQLVEAQFFSGKGDFNNVIRRLFAIDDSEQRARQLRKQIGAVEFQPRRREDVDFIFMAALPQQARQIKPTLAFNFAGHLPVIATSHVYTGDEQRSKDRDLEGVVFCDIPWVLKDNDLKSEIQSLWPQNRSGFDRLYALGVDAFQLYPRLGQFKLLANSQLPANTGQLSMDEYGQIIRHLPFAVFTRGRPTLTQGYVRNVEQPDS